RRTMDDGHLSNRADRCARRGRIGRARRFRRDDHHVTLLSPCWLCKVVVQVRRIAQPKGWRRRLKTSKPPLWTCDSAYWSSRSSPLPLTLGAEEQASKPAATSGSFAYGHTTAVPVAVAVHRSTAIALDAKLDEDAWKAATPITDFRQVDPDEGQPASQRTEVRFLFDEDALYVGAKMYDLEGANGVVTRLVVRDGSFDSDYLELVIDAYHDHLSRAFFDLNPSGSKDDYIGLGTSCC